MKPQRHLFLLQLFCHFGKGTNPKRSKWEEDEEEEEEEAGEPEARQE